MNSSGRRDWTFASAISSATEFAFTPGLTSRISGLVLSRLIGTMSRSGSYGSFSVAGEMVIEPILQTQNV